MTPTDGWIADSSPSEEDVPGAEVDRTVLSALVREIIATHFFVWTMNDSGGLQSVKISVSDISQQISGAGRILDRDFDQALQMVLAASKAFDAAAQDWESQVRHSEQKLRAEMTAGKLNQVKGLHNQIRTRVGPLQSLFQRALRVFREVEMSRQRQANNSLETRLAAEDEPGAGVPKIVPVVIPGEARLSEGFLELFTETPSEKRRSLLEQYFFTSRLTVDFGEVEDRHVNVIIPRPTVDQFYYLKKTAQIIRVTQEAGADDMLVHDPETDSSDGMSSETFVTHVQTGVWLLRPKPLG